MPRDLATEMADRLAAEGRVRWSLDDLVALLVELRPELATNTERWGLLAEAVESWAAEGVVRPSRRRVPRGGRALSSSVVVTGVAPSRRAEENPALRHPWVPSMRWVAAGPRRPVDQHRRLVAINAWLAANPAPRPVPERERSLEVLGDDKALGPMLAGVLASRPEVLAALATRRVHPPMAVGDVAGAAGRAALVVENGTTFHSAVDAARTHAAEGRPVAYAWVGFGVGNQLERLLPSLASLGPAALDYFGDLDAKGLDIAARAARVAGRDGLPPLRPAAALYAALLDRGRPQPARGGHVDWPAAGLDWLGPALASRLRSTLGTTTWLAQEWVGLTALLDDSSWCGGTGAVSVAPTPPE